MLFCFSGDYIYWTDWQMRSIERVNKYTGHGREVIIEQLPDLMGLKTINVRLLEGRYTVLVMIVGKTFHLARLAQKSGLSQQVILKCRTTN